MIAVLDGHSHCCLLHGMVDMYRAPAGLEPACVPPGVDGQAVIQSIIPNVSASVASLPVSTVAVGVSMYTP